MPFILGSFFPLKEIRYELQKNVNVCVCNSCEKLKLSQCSDGTKNKIFYDLWTVVNIVLGFFLKFCQPNVTIAMNIAVTLPVVFHFIL